jgi:hypothetical protein
MRDELTANNRATQRRSIALLNAVALSPAWVHFFVGLNERVRLGGAFYQCEGLGGTIPTSRDVKTGYMRDSVGYAGGTSVYPGTEYLYVPLPTSKGPYRLVLHCFPESTFTAEHRKGIGLRIVQATTYLPSSVRTLPFAQRFISRCSGSCASGK